MKKLIKIFLPIALLLAGCAPGLGTEVEVTALPLMYVGRASSFKDVGIGVKKFSDERREKDSIQINDRRVTITGNLGTIVQGGFTEALKQGGARLCQFDCATIEGDIVEWSMKAQPQFPATKVTSRAKIVVRLMSKEGKLLYTGTYGGSMSGEHPYYNEDRLLEAFGTSMNEAIRSAMGDRNLAEMSR